jgi:hypothetical protein
MRRYGFSGRDVQRKTGLEAQAKVESWTDRRNRALLLSRRGIRIEDLFQDGFRVRIRSQSWDGHRQQNKNALGCHGVASCNQNPKKAHIRGVNLSQRTLLSKTRQGGLLGIEWVIALNLLKFFETMASL